MKKFVVVVVSLIILAGTGLVHGWWTERWVKSEALREAVAKVALVPNQVGEWTAEDLPGQEEDFNMAGALGYWTRVYRHPRHAGSILVILMCGRSGHMAVHTPEVCYRGAGFDMLEEPIAYTVRNESGEGLGQFRTARFAKPVGGSRDLRLFWTWNATGSWVAPASPRWEFGGKPFLYKLYVSHENASPNDRLGDDLGVIFLRQFLPEVDRVLFPLETGNQGS